MSPRLCLAILMAATLGFAACGSSNVSPGDAGAGGAPGAGGSPGDAACQPSFEPNVCGWTACTQSVAAYCAEPNARCLTQWPADVTGFCSTWPGELHITQDCGPYRVVSQVGIDGGSNAFYSAATGQLVAIASFNANFETALCLGGPADFVEPSCPGRSDLLLSCADAGGTGGSSGLGGAAGSGGAGGALDAGAE